MSRIVPFDIEAICDECGKKGAYDFMGDFFCEECTKKIVYEPEYTRAIYVDVWYNNDISCEVCGAIGSYDLGGDHVCEECALKNPKYDVYKEED